MSLSSTHFSRFSSRHKIAVASKLGKMIATCTNSGLTIKSLKLIDNVGCDDVARLQFGDIGNPIFFFLYHLDDKILRIQDQTIFYIIPKAEPDYLRQQHVIKHHKEIYDLQLRVFYLYNYSMVQPQRKH
mmetsp:Transcript_282/g.391  ORF Transcript_282/g.391 Transcript_282/m.391 type:complete len:129 (+) Transcript_282:1554-1940(+)